MIRRALLLLGAALFACDGLDPAGVGEDESSLSSDPTLAHTTEGWVRGRVEGARRAFRGIRYAAAPIGELRFRPPQPPPSHADVVEAGTLGPRCPQKLPSGVDVGDEDCLQLNIYTPADATPRSRLPVLVWLHGGGNRRGDVIRDDSMTLPQHGMVVVTLHYRLNAFGGLAHPALSREQGGTSGNYLLLDQLAALRWVQANIGAFGGDPRRVLLGGQSAGSGDVEVLLATDAAGQLFHAGAMHSYAQVPPEEPGPTTLAAAEANGVRVARVLGCADVACLRAAPVNAVIDASWAVTDGYADLILDGRLIREDPFARLRRLGSPVPLIAGSTSEEIDVDFGLADGDYQAALAANFPDPDTILALYPLADYPSAGYALAAALTDQHFTCLYRAFAWAVGGSTRRPPIYRYVFTHGRTNAAPHESAYHRSELGFLFGDIEIEADGPYVPTAEELALSDAMMGYWTRFAASGDPNGAGAPRWDATDATAEPLLRIETGSQLGMLGAYHPRQCDHFKPLAF